MATLKNDRHTWRPRLPLSERLPIVPATRGLRKNPGEPSSRMPAAFTGTRAANGDVTRLTSLVLGRSKAESVSTFERALVLRPGMLRRSLRCADRGSAGRSRTPGIVR